MVVNMVYVMVHNPIWFIQPSNIICPQIETKLKPLLTINHIISPCHYQDVIHRMEQDGENMVKQVVK